MEQEAQLQTKRKKTKSAFDRRKITTTLSTVALVLAVIFCIVVVGQVLSQGYVSLFGFSLFRVVTPSMEPTMPVDTLLISQDVSISDIQVGDIVVFKSKMLEVRGSVVTHRVTQVLKSTSGEIMLETKGDANQYPDGHNVTQADLIGRVIFHTEDGNFFSGLVKMVTSPMGFFAAIVIPCLVIGVIIMRGTISSIRKEMEVLSTELNEQEQEQKKQEQEQKEQEAAEYEQLRNRLRAELLEELKQGADQEETTE